MTITVAIPVLGNKPLLDKCLDLLQANASGQWSPLVIDNGSKERMGAGLTKKSYLRNEDNIGMVKSLALALLNCHTDILIYMHSDMFLYEQGWDERISSAFSLNERLGLLGVVGAKVAETDGGRSEVFCSFRDAEVHGTKTPSGVHPVVLLDGCLMAFRVQAMHDAEIPDLSYSTHHFYDKAWSLAMVLAGYSVGVIDLDSEHLGGQTSCQKEYQQWAKSKTGKEDGDREIYLQNERKYLQDYGPVLPVRVDDRWNYTTIAGPVFNSGRRWFA